MMKLAVYNDTSSSGHAGCSCVMRVIESKIKKLKLKKEYSWPYNVNWRLSKELIKEVDVFIVNGEGTLHDDNQGGGAYFLIELIDYLLSQDKRVILVNSELYQLSNKALNTISKCDFIGCRNRYSYNLINRFKDVREKSDFIYDYSLYYKFPKSSQRTSESVVIDSADSKEKGRLRAFSQEKKFPYIKMETFLTGIIFFRVFELPYVERVLFLFPDRVRAFFGRLIIRKMSKVNRKRAVNKFLQAIGKYGNIYTGRYHGMLISLINNRIVWIEDKESKKIMNIVDDLNSQLDFLGQKNGRFVGLKLIKDIDDREIDKQWDLIDHVLSMSE